MVGCRRQREPVAGEVVSPRRRSHVRALEAFIGMLVEIPAALLVVAEIVIAVRGCRGALRRAAAADLVRRTRLDPVPVAGDARIGGRISSRRAHADDRCCGERDTGRARLSRCRRDLCGAGFPAVHRWSGLSIRLRGKLHHDAGVADFQQLARGGVTGRHRPDGAVCGSPIGCGSAIPARC